MVMPGSWRSRDFPNLNNDNCTLTSPATPIYNCIAWAAREDSRWWWPDPRQIAYWPDGVSRELSVAAFVAAFETLGFRLCEGGLLEAGVEKIAIYGIDKNGVTEPTHAAMQLPSGKWTSKLGPLEDVAHDTAEDVNGPIYGKPVVFLSRSRE